MDSSEAENARCRLCLKFDKGNGAFVDLFDEQAGPLRKKIMAIARIKIELNDQLPPCICLTCHFELESIFKFRTLCETSDAELRKDLNQKKMVDISLSLQNKKSKALKKKTKNSHGVLKRREPNSVKGIPYKKKLHQCEICGKTCQKLEAHIRMHTKVKPYDCSVCKKSFSLRHHLKAHAVKHTKKKLYQCTECGKFLSEKSSLLRHSKIHGGDKKHSCCICQKRFISLQEAKQHRMSHTKEKIFCCGSCPKKFTHASSLCKHKKTHV